MRKIFIFLIIIISLFYILSEFVGDRIIKGTLENNLSNVLDRETSIEKLKINYRKGDAEIYNLKIKNKEFDGNLLQLEKAYLKLNTSSIFSNNIEIDNLVLDGIDLNYFFNIEYTIINDNVRSLEKTLRTGSGKSTSTKYFNIKKLSAKNIVLSVNSNDLKINKNISLQNLEFKNVGNTANSNNYKTILRDFANQTVNVVKKKIFSGNFKNKLNEIKNIDANTLKKKLKEKLGNNKLKNKLEKLLD